MRAEKGKGSAQQELDLRRDKNGQKRGGARRNAGRKPAGPRAGIPHRSRAALRPGVPVHVTLRVRREAAGLRRRRQYQAIRAVMRRTGHKADFRIVHYSVQGNHFHLICEATDQQLLSRGVQGFSSLVARRINQMMGRTGKFFSDRYHVHALTTPTEVRNALCYVLNNWRKHREHVDHRRWALDPFSSADLFDGWLGALGKRHAGAVKRPGWVDPDERSPVARATCWLLTTGWRKAGLLSPTETPGPRENA
jgi:REP element-mobilizing transposase RayT